jgi:hypothetical protein
MTLRPHAAERLRLQTIIESLRKQVNHDAEIRSMQADRIYNREARILELESDLAEAVAAGSRFADALAWSVPDSPESLFRCVGLSD